MLIVAARIRIFTNQCESANEIAEEAGEEAIEQAAAKQEPLFESIFTIDEGTEQNTEGGVA